MSDVKKTLEEKILAQLLIDRVPEECPYCGCRAIRIAKSLSPIIQQYDDMLVACRGIIKYRNANSMSGAEADAIFMAVEDAITKAEAV